MRQLLSNGPSSKRRIFVLGLVGLIVLGVGWYWLGMFSVPRPGTNNAIMVVAPYWYQGTWVFDDAATGLKREPFVAGVPEMIDVLVKDVPDAKNGFRLLFSANKFPGSQKELTWLRGDSGGNFYRLEDPSMEGWLCPAMFKYYQAAPPKIYVRAEPVNREKKANTE